MARPLTFAPFDVVVIPFPYSDALAEKRRPAVVISMSNVEAQHGWLWVAMVTSAPGPERIGDTPINDLGAAGLNRPCRVRGAKLAAIDRSRILRRVGALSNTDQTLLRRALASCAAW